MSEDSYLKRAYDVTRSMTQALCGPENHRKTCHYRKAICKHAGFLASHQQLNYVRLSHSQPHVYVYDVYG